MDELSSAISKDQLRRQPRQQRSRQRVNAILDAAEQLFSESGFSATTTNAIARRAKTNIASLYQYFPNKEAILEAVVRRYRQEYDALAEQVFQPGSEALPLEALVEQLSQAVYELHLSHAVVRPFFARVGETNSEFAVSEWAIYGGILQKADQQLAYRIPELSSARRQVALQVFLRVIQALVALAHVADAAHKAWILQAMKTMLQAYLNALAGDSAHDGTPPENAAP